MQKSQGQYCDRIQTVMNWSPRCKSFKSLTHLQLVVHNEWSLKIIGGKIGY